MQGTRWKIGNGDKIRVFQDRWLMNGGLAQPAAQHNQLLQLNVTELLQPGQKSWDLDVMQHYLSPQSVCEAMNTPLFNSIAHDERVWRLHKRVIYTVRSDYKFCLTELVENAGLEVEGDWMSIWKLAVPPKVRNFIWRVARNCLPTRVRLSEKGVQIGTICPWCNVVPETATHILMECNKSRETWVKLNLINYIDQAQLQHGS